MPLLSAVLACVLLALSACKPQASSTPAAHFNSSDITGINYAQGFSLPDSAGKTRTLAEFKGKAVVVFFGYTHCPDVCPITLDPARDTPEVLRQYVPAFDPSFIGLVGNEAQTAQTAKDFRVYFQKTAGSAPGQYTVDHTAASFVFDKQGRPRLYVRYNQGADKLAADLRQILVQ